MQNKQTKIMVEAAIMIAMATVHQGFQVTLGWIYYTAFYVTNHHFFYSKRCKAGSWMCLCLRLNPVITGNCDRRSVRLGTFSCNVSRLYPFGLSACLHSTWPCRCIP